MQVFLRFKVFVQKDFTLTYKKHEKKNIQVLRN